MGAGVLCGRSAGAGPTGGRVGRHPPPAHPWSALPAATDAGGGPTDVRTSAAGAAWASGGAAGRAASLRRGTSRRTRAGTWESPCDVRRGHPAAGVRVAAAGGGSRNGAGALIAGKSGGGRPGGHRRHYRDARGGAAPHGAGRAAGRVAVSVSFGRRVPLPRSRVQAASIVSEPCSVELISITCTPFLLPRSVGAVCRAVRDAANELRRAAEGQPQPARSVAAVTSSAGKNDSIDNSARVMSWAVPNVAIVLKNVRSVPPERSTNGTNSRETVSGTDPPGPAGERVAADLLTPG